MKAYELIGKRFGRLTVVGRAENTRSGKCQWLCVCDCGSLKKKPVLTNDLITEKVKSCGCLYKESNKDRNRKHGMTHSRVYRIWQGMRQRCTRGENYAGRGISICVEWDVFQAFYQWAMANGYSDNLTIDRIDNDKGYYPDNCRWVDMKVQQNNRRNNRIVTYYGIDFTLSELAEKFGISPETLRQRIERGWGQADWGMKPDLNNKNIRR